uniref:cohesin domain-containing protein n=1 Tax=Gemmiger sp. TaxID=2049027 RepID=UPI003A938A60
MEPWLSIKKRLKRPLSLFTAVAMMLTTTFSALPVMAEGVPTFAASSTSANPGDTVEITISIENNPGITSAAMDVSFPDELTLTSVSLKRDVYTGQFNGPQSLPVTKKVRLNWANGLADNSTSGLFATLNFSVSESAGEGTYPISITYDPD